MEGRRDHHRSMQREDKTWTGLTLSLTFADFEGNLDTAYVVPTTDGRKQ